MKQLLKQYGSFRKLVEAYWLGELTMTDEQEVEEFTPKDILSNYKPVHCPRCGYLDKLEHSCRTGTSESEASASQS
jgi:hypothetical protein